MEVDGEKYPIDNIKIKFVHVNILSWTCPCGKKNTFDLNKYKSIVKRGYLEMIFDAKLCPKCFVKSLRGGLND